MSDCPNENIFHIAHIEGLLCQVNEHLKEIKPHYRKEHIAKEQAREEVNSLQTGSLHDLRLLCEGD